MLPMKPEGTTFRGSLLEGTDHERIVHLAALSRTRPPEGVVLLAEVHGEAVAAVGIFDGQMVSDPARSTVLLQTRLHLLRVALRVIATLRGF
jgi:hypothetical protein